jgi:hypothetical protein
MVVVIAAKGTSFQFRLIVGFLVERVFMDCSIVLAILFYVTLGQVYLIDNYLRIARYYRPLLYIRVYLKLYVF